MMIDDLDDVFERQLRRIRAGLRTFTTQMPPLTPAQKEQQGYIRDKKDLLTHGELERRGNTKHAPGGRS